MAALIVNPRSRIFHGHEWVYGTEVRSVTGAPAPGSVVTLKDIRNRPLGSAIYNPASRIAARRFSRRAQDLDDAFFRRRIARAAAYRERLGFGPEHPHRVVWSEADGLPGVVLDRYGRYVVLQTLTLAMDQRRDRIAEAALAEIQGAATVIERNDSPIRRAEGLDPRSGVLLGPATDAAEIVVETASSVRFHVDLVTGQKTGLYLDQFDNYRAVAEHAAGRSVLDVFCNQGGFALHAARAGAASVLAVDASEGAVESVRRNAELNGVAVDAVCANAFDYLKRCVEEGKHFDLVVLDPPSFTRSRERREAALRGYKEIHLRAFQLLAPGGILATFCCSHHVSGDDFDRAIGAAAVDARRTAREIGVLRQRRDHPVLLNLPETEYLKGRQFEVIASW